MPNLKIFTNNVEQEAINQINELVAQPVFSDCKIRIMPDAHAGKGCVIGFTADLGNKVIPNIVGVDIGCGVLCVNLGKIEIDFEKLDRVIREKVPSGHSVQKEEKSIAHYYISQLYCQDGLVNLSRLYKSLGTLGGGNHYIEIDKDFDDNKYLTIHTGSRNLGKQVADYYQDLAIRNQQMKFKTQRDQIIYSLKQEGKEAEIEENLRELNKLRVPDHFAYLEGVACVNYLHDMVICQDFAVSNRVIIADEIVTVMGWNVLNSFESVHNYIDFNSNIVRKGAISAQKGQRLIIPLNMRDGCIIGVGKGNADWNYSAPHGAGRIMSRSAARKSISIEDYKDSMDGIYTTSVNESTIDESPFAYKPSGEIIRVIEPTVEIEAILKPIYNFKAN